MQKSGLNFNKEKFGLPIYRKVNPVTRKCWELMKQLEIKEREMLCQN